MTTYKTIDEANEAIAQKIIAAQPTLVDVVRAKTVIPELDGKLILHAGPPIAFEDMPDPVQGAAIGAALFEGWAEDEAVGPTGVFGGGRVRSEHHFRAVGAMGGILSGNLPVFVVENRTDGNRAYTTMHEGEGKVLRFGVYDESVGEHLIWMRDVLGAALSKALKLLPGRRAGRESHPGAGGRDGRRVPRPHHGRVEPAVPRARARSWCRSGCRRRTSSRCWTSLPGTSTSSSRSRWPAGRRRWTPRRRSEDGSIVTCLTRNGREFAIRVSGLGDRWFTGPEDKLDTLYFPGFTEDDACPDCGDSAILEAYGLGGLVAVAAPSVQQMVGTGEGGFEEALATSEEQAEIVVANNPNMPIPNWNFRGVPVGIDIRKVVATGIAPLITTAVMHKKAGIGMVGVGKVRASMPCFTAALEALAEARGAAAAA